MPWRVDLQRGYYGLKHGIICIGFTEGKDGFFLLANKPGDDWEPIREGPLFLYLADHVMAQLIEKGFARHSLLFLAQIVVCCRKIRGTASNQYATCTTLFLVFWQEYADSVGEPLSDDLQPANTVPFELQRSLVRSDFAVFTHVQTQEDDNLPPGFVCLPAFVVQLRCGLRSGVMALAAAWTAIL